MLISYVPFPSPLLRSQKARCRSSKYHCFFARGPFMFLILKHCLCRVSQRRFRLHVRILCRLCIFDVLRSQRRNVPCQPITSAIAARDQFCYLHRSLRRGSTTVSEYPHRLRFFSIEYETSFRRHLYQLCLCAESQLCLRFSSPLTYPGESRPLSCLCKDEPLIAPLFHQLVFFSLASKLSIHLPRQSRD